MSITLTVCDIESSSTRRFVSKPKWFMADAEILQRYKSELNSVLKTMSIPLLVSHCNMKCEIVYFKNMIKKKWQKNVNNQNKLNMIMLIRRLQNIYN